MKLNITLAITFFVVLAFIIPTFAHAQPDFNDNVDELVPVDGGLSLLIAAGVGYGVKKVRERTAK